MASIIPTTFEASSERTVSADPSGSPTVAPPTLSSAHHFVSIKLSTRNYLFWRTQMVPFLRGQGLLRFVDGSFPCPLPVAVTAGDAAAPVDRTAVLVWEQQDQAILSMLVASLSEEVMYLAVGQATSRQVWLSIEGAFGSSTRARALGLLSQLQGLRQGDSTPAEFLGRAKVIIEELAMAGRPVTLDEQNLYVFRGLRPEFRAMASSLVTSGTPVTISQLSNFLVAQQFICSDDFPPILDSQPAALVSRRGGGRQSGGRGGQRGGGRSARGGGRGGRGPRCQIFRSHGHTAVFCFRCYSDQPQVNVASTVDGGELASSGSAAAWFPDTGATHHTSPSDAGLTDTEPYTGSDTLRVGSGEGLSITRIGHALISSSMSNPLKLSDVLVVPGLSTKLLSVQKFSRDNNVFFEFFPSFFVVKDIATNTVLLKGPSSGGTLQFAASCVALYVSICSGTV
ncbi:PREDICTED: uncharacterized protein LOC109151881 [Ipomoea nil]|uniref:uncharacterized protein LOC109151881 n=1 Tax=Ipomoea nil TaxID=35883 RepID=UPI0009011A80|nr:PREDICTED: uncharacterized protein LOC109151881 [Ipomoea nil]